MPEVAPAGSSFADLVDMVTERYDASRAADGEADSSIGMTSFALKAWIGERPFRAGAPTGRPDLRYWIAPHGGAQAAAALLLLLSRTAPMSDPPLVEPASRQREHEIRPMLARAPSH